MEYIGKITFFRDFPDNTSRNNTVHLTLTSSARHSTLPRYSTQLQLNLKDIYVHFLSKNKNEQNDFLTLRTVENSQINGVYRKNYIFP